MLENEEEILRLLEQFSKSATLEIPKELDEFLLYVAASGDPCFSWCLLKRLIMVKFEEIINDILLGSSHVMVTNERNMPPFDLISSKEFLFEKINKFNGVPFTIQRVCELLTTSRKQYSRIDKFVRAFEKNILVVSTIKYLFRDKEVDFNNGFNKLDNNLEEMGNEAGSRDYQHNQLAAMAQEHKIDNSGALFQNNGTPANPFWHNIENNSSSSPAELKLILESTNVDEGESHFDNLSSESASTETVYLDFEEIRQTVDRLVEQTVNNSTLS